MDKLAPVVDVKALSQRTADQIDVYAQAHELQHKHRKERRSVDDGDSSRLGEDSDESDELVVERERDEGFERLSVARNHVEKQESIYKNIMMKIAEYGEDDQGAGSGAAELQESVDVLPPEALALLATSATGERGEHSRFVAEQLLRRQLRLAKFHKNHSICREKQQQYRDEMHAKNQAADERLARWQYDSAQARQQKTFIAQQKRNEQQKMLKEIQRDQEHQLDVLQAKHHASWAASSPPRPPTGPRTARAPPPPSGAPRPGSSPHMDRSVSDSVLHEQIYKDMCKSRALYNSEFERWEKRAQENERRTEAHWRKMLQGEHRHRSKDDDKPKGQKLFKRAVKEVKTLKTFVKKNPLDSSDFGHMEPLPGDVGFFDDGTSDPMEVTFPPIASTSPGSTYGSTCSSPIGKPSPKSELRKERMQRVQSFHQTLEENNMVKKARDEIKVDEAVQRHKSFTRERAAEASSINETWDQRCKTATQKRARASNFCDELLSQKQEDWSSKWQEEQARLQEEREKAAESKKAMHNELISGSVKQQEVTESLLRQKAAQKEERTLMKRAEIRENQERKLGNESDTARTMKERKARYVEEFRKAAEKEIQHKETRSQKALKSVTKPPSTLEALDRHRARRQEAQERVAIRPKELELPPELALRPELMLSPKRKPVGKRSGSKQRDDHGQNDDDANATSADESGMLGVASPTTAASSDVAPSPLAVAAAAVEHRMSSSPPVNQTHSRGHAETRRQATDEETIEIRAHRKKSDTEHSPGEKEFLQKLQVWSTVELQKIRKQEADRPTGVY